MSRLLRPALALLLSALFLAVGPVARAHDELLEASPADGEELDASPEEIRLTFSGQIAEVGAQVAVNGESAVLDGPPRVEGTAVVQDLTDLSPGDYEVMWRVTSQDGHPISGTFVFTVAGVATDVDEPAETAAEETTAEASTGGTAEPTATQEDPAATLEDPAATEDAPATEPTDDESTAGTPGWVWLVSGVAVAGLLALLARTWIRGRR